MKLSKALNALDDCKDQFQHQRDTPIKPPELSRAVFSPENRLMSAPFQQERFMSSFYSQKDAFRSTIGPGSPVPQTKDDLKFTVDLNGVPHSVKMNPTEATGKLLGLYL